MEICQFGDNFFCWADNGKTVYFFDDDTGEMLGISRLSTPYDYTTIYFDGETIH